MNRLVTSRLSRALCAIRRTKSDLPVRKDVTPENAVFDKVTHTGQVGLVPYHISLPSGKDFRDKPGNHACGYCGQKFYNPHVTSEKDKDITYIEC
uniref:Uncharacterized protein n=1 Tax=Parascaris equorum TaxID=6256 RepID=A0A914RH19_PAREQ